MGNAVARVNGHAYENEGLLAEGGFASVYRVRRGGVDYALKSTRGIGDDAQLQRVLLEIQVQRKLQHPNALRLVEAEVRQQRAGDARTGADAALAPAPRKEVLMVFPLYPRGTLQQHLEAASAQQTPAFSEAETLRVFTLIVEAVLELQARGYAHRDIKPQNVLLTSTDPVDPVLTDFGSLSPVKTTVSSAVEALLLFEDTAQFCSAGFRAPELWEGHSSTALRGEIDFGRADVWSLGCLLYAMTFGPYSPFESATQGVLQLAIYSGTVRFPPDNRCFGQQFSSALVALIKSMLTVSPQDRPSTYELLDIIDDLRTGRRAGYGGSKRSFSLRRSISGHQAAANISNEEEWADFSVFADESDRTHSPHSHLIDTSLVSSSASYSSWQVVPRQTSLAARSTRRVRSIRDESVQQRRQLSAKGRKLLATALVS